jgi:hypothetical protein
VRIHAIALGMDAVGQTDVYERLAEVNGGRYVPIWNAGELPEILPYLSFSDLDVVRVRNLTSEAPAEAVRSFPDGVFDAYVRLVPGENRLEIEAALDDGRRARTTRTVVYTRPDSPSAEDRADAAALRERIRLRTVEMGLAAEARAARERQRRRLTLEAIPD